MSETYSVYNQNGTLVNETAVCRVVKIRAGVYTWEIAGGSAASTDSDAQVSDDNYSIIRAEITSTERAGVPIEWAVNSAGDFYVVAVCGSQIIDGLPDSAFAYDSQQKVLWLECPFENAEEWVAYIYRAERPVNNFAIAEGRARISGIQAQFEKDNRVMRQIIAERVRLLRTPDVIKTLPPKDGRAGKVLAFDADGNPIAEISTADIEEIVGALNDIMVAKSVAEFAAREASQASSVATEKMTETVNAKAQTENLANAMVGLANAVDAAVADFNSTVNTKVAAVGSAETSALANISTAKTNAVGDVNSAKSTALTNIGTAKTNALSDISTAKANAVSDISTIKGEVQSAGTTATGNIADAKTAALSDISTAKTGAVGDVGTAKTNALGDISTAKTNAVADVGTAKTEAVSDVNTAKAAALSDITDAGASYQRQITRNALALEGAAYSPNTSYSLYPMAMSGAWDYRSISVASMKFTAIGRYLPISGEWRLFESYNSSMYDGGSSPMLIILGDGKTIQYTSSYDMNTYNTNYISEELNAPLEFGDIVSYVYDSGNVKVYINKENVIDYNTPSGALIGEIQSFSNILNGVNFKQNFLLDTRNAWPLQDDVKYSISNFVDGVSVPAGLLTAHTNVNKTSFSDATGLSLSYITGTYSQSFSSETGCAKFVPGGLHATTKRVRSLYFQSDLLVAGNATAKLRIKFYLPTSNANWAYVGIKPTSAILKVRENTSVLDDNKCAAAYDGWQTVELTVRNTSASGQQIRIYLQQSSDAGISSTAIGQAISSASNDVFYLSELSIEYQSPIDNYVKAPTKNGVFVQCGTLGDNIVPVITPSDYTALLDTGANIVTSTARNQDFYWGSVYIQPSGFDFIPLGKYWLKSISVRFKSLSEIGDSDTITINANQTSYVEETFSKSDAVDKTLTVYSKYPNAQTIEQGFYFYGLSVQTSAMVNSLEGDLILNWERIN